MLKLILAGILALPCFLAIVVAAPIIGLLALPSLCLLIYQKQKSSTTNTTTTTTIPDHVIIVGGSSGIGKSIAEECVRRGISKISILARNETKLKATKNNLVAIATANANGSATKTTAESTTTTATSDNKKKDYGSVTSNGSSLSSSSTNGISITTHSVSVSDYGALQKVATELLDTSDSTASKNQQQPQQQTIQPRVVLFNCAGIPYTTEFEKVPIEQYEKLIHTNQLGAMYVVRAFLPFLNDGTIVLCSSAAAQVGVYGYSVYSPTKYALRGFAETLHAELIRSKPNLSIQIAFPADTNTPGYEEETKMMPEITKALNESGGLANPNDTAKEMVSCAFAKNPKFAVYFNLEGWMLANLTAGMSPVSSLGDAIAQVALTGLFRLISLFVLNDWWMTIRNFPHKDKESDDDIKHQQKEPSKKAD